jgi:hypothetical protein
MFSDNFDVNFNAYIDAERKVFLTENMRISCMKWYKRHSASNTIEESHLVELLIFMHDHVDLDCYQLSHYLCVADFLCNEYGIVRERIPQMVDEFRNLL